MKIYIGYDHRGEKLSSILIENLINAGYEINLPYDNNFEQDDYPDISMAVCSKVKKDKSSIGILICGTGIGMCMAANREGGIRAVLASSEEQAYFARRHENANVLVFAAGYGDEKYKIKEPKNIINIIDVFIKTEFEGGRHKNRVKKLEVVNKN